MDVSMFSLSKENIYYEELAPFIFFDFYTFDESYSNAINIFLFLEFNIKKDLTTLKIRLLYIINVSETFLSFVKYILYVRYGCLKDVS